MNKHEHMAIKFEIQISSQPKKKTITFYYRMQKDCNLMNMFLHSSIKFSLGVQLNNVCFLLEVVIGHY